MTYGNAASITSREPTHDHIGGGAGRGRDGAGRRTRPEGRFSSARWENEPALPGEAVLACLEDDGVFYRGRVVDRRGAVVEVGLTNADGGVVKVVQAHRANCFRFPDPPAGPGERVGPGATPGIDSPYGARFFGRKSHSRMPLEPMHVRLKLLHACDQWHSSRVFTPLTD
jgi:hypothetical protein